MHTGTQRNMSAELTGARRTSRGEKPPLFDYRKIAVDRKWKNVYSK